MFRLAFLVFLAIGLTVCGATVKLGKRTFFGHISAIWNTEEAKDAREGITPVVKKVGDKAEDVGEKVAPVVKKKVHELTEDEGSGSASGSAKKPKPKAPDPKKPAGPATSHF